MCFDRLAKLSTAEEFFLALGVPYDPAVVNVSRLHILKRFGELTRAHGDSPPEGACREALSQAYGEFASGQGAKNFKVFKDAQPGFVPLSALKPVAKAS
jgi:nitrogenase-stabilizing/protective protein